MKRTLCHLMILVPSIIICLTAAAFGQGPKVISADGGNSHTIALRDDGTVWTYGDNKYYGQLGDGTWIDKNIPTLVALPRDVVAIASGPYHCLVLRSDGTVWGWGSNSYYQLGDGTNINKPAPVQVKDPSDPTGFLTGVEAVAAGNVYSIALKTNGTVWTWGYNGSGSLGDGTYDNRTQPVQVKDPSDPSGFLQGIVAVAAGAGSSIALKSNGTVWTWGGGDYAQIGRIIYGTGSTPQNVAGQVAGMTDVAALAAGWEHNVVLKKNGTVWACGRNSEGQLGDGTTIGSSFPPPEPPKFFVQVIDPADPTGYLTGITAIAADDRYSLAVKSNGTAWGWGSNYAGVLCDGTTNNIPQTSPAQMKDPSDPTGFLTGVKAVGAGEYHSLMIKNDGTLWGCGWNYVGQLGIGTYDTPKTTPVQALFPEPSMLYLWSMEMMSPGEEVTFLIEYENVLGETLDDAVVILDLPGGFLYTSSTNDGIYRDDRSEVFWKLGDVSPGQTGSMSVKVEVPWGLPLHTEITLFADMAARNITSSINVDDYLTYVPVEVISETTFTEAEINDLLASDQELKGLFDHALSLGYAFDNVAEQLYFSDGSSSKVFVLIDPQQYGPIFLKKVEDEVFIERYQEDVYVYSLFNKDGGYSINTNDGSVTPWGTWAEAHSPAFFTCISNCITIKIPTWNDYIRDKFNGKNTQSCIACQQALEWEERDPVNCGKCATIYLLVLERKKRLKDGNVIGQCKDDCKNTSKWQCAPGEALSFCSRFSPFLVLSSREIIEYSYCKSSSAGSIWGCGHDDLCDKACEDGYICRDYPLPHCASPCEEEKSQSQSSYKVISIPSCEPHLKPRTAEVRTGGDPNEKSVDSNGDVIPGQKITYTIDCENVGTGTAYGVFILDTLDINLDEATLVINNGGSYSSVSRLLSWDIGTLPPQGKGSVTFSVNVKNGLPSGTDIINRADVYFPSVPEITPTNPIVSTVKAIAADPKTVETTAGTPVSITLTGRDSGSHALTYRITTPLQYGTLTGTPPNVTYTSMDEFSGQDEFSFVVNNGTVDSDPAKVKIIVNPNSSDTTPPTVTGTYPKAGKTSVHVIATPFSTEPPLYLPAITATFSEPIDSATITTTFTIGGITGTVGYDEESRTASFIPSKALSYSTTYTARLSTGIKDKVGNSMASEFSWQFTTESQANIAVTLPDNATEIVFGNVGVSTISEGKVASIQNTGTTNLSLGTVALGGTNAGDFTIAENGCAGMTLAQSDNCTVKVTFTPTATGSRNATLSIPSNDQDTPTFTVQLKGTGILSAGCSIWSDVISKYTAYVSGQASWTDVIECYQGYVSSD